MKNSKFKNQRVWPVLAIGLGIIIIGGGFVGFLSQGFAVSSTYGVDFPPSHELIDKWNIEHFASAIGFSQWAASPDRLHITHASGMTHQGPGFD